MRKEKRFEAYLDDFNVLTVYLSKQFYQGKSEVFYTRDTQGELNKLTIKYKESTSNDYSKYILTGCEFLEFGKEYELVEEHGLATPLQIGLIVKKDKFDKMFHYSGNDLGAHVIKDKTIFAVWAPTAIEVFVKIVHDNETFTYPLDREAKGVFKITVNKNLHLAYYTYLVNVNGSYRESVDPYGRGTNANGQKSVVIDDAQVNVNLNNDSLEVLKSPTDAIIYETSIRDFSSDENSSHRYKKTFKGFIERNTTTQDDKKTGFDYVLDLGVTHIQLMPIYDFATIDEMNVDVFYNWGYDPHQYNVPEGSFSTDINDPLSRILELKELVATCHKHGLRIIMDVVYNHVYDMYQSSFEKIVPYYYFRRSESGAVSNGSFCENDLDSNRLMVRKFIVDSCKMWVKDYGIDGFRFDLMGILDVDTMNIIDNEVRNFKPDALLYGEGWNMPTILDEDKKAMRENQHLMPNIGHFNDFYRDHVKGRTSEHEISIKGYCSGDVFYKDAMKMCLVGNTLEEPFLQLFDTPTKSINYVECHDNRTSWDKLKECCKEDQREVRIRKHKMMIASIMVSIGIPFLHSGQEFCRTKNGIHKSFLSGDLVNKLDWERKDRYQDVVNYTKDMIKLRKNYSVFRFNNTEQIKKHVYFQDLENDVLLYGFRDVSDYIEYDELLVFFNPTKEVGYHCLENYGTLIANEAGLIEKIQVQCITINPNTMVVVGI